MTLLGRRMPGVITGSYGLPIRVLALWLVLALWMAAAHAMAPRPSPQRGLDMQLELRDYLEAHFALAAEAAQPGQFGALAEFYRLRDYRPAWQSPAVLAALLDALASLEADGLNPEDYQLSQLRLAPPLLGDNSPEALPLRLADELKASSAYLRALYHLYNGKVDGDSLQPRWQFDWQALAPEPLRQQLLAAADTGQPAQAFTLMRPQHPIYEGLRRGLQQYRQLQALGGWPSLAAGPTLKPCAIDPQVAVLRRRLAVSGEYLPPVEAVIPPEAGSPWPEPIQRCIDLQARLASSSAASSSVGAAFSASEAEAAAPGAELASEVGMAGEAQVDNAHEALLAAEAAAVSQASQVSSASSSVPRAINPDEVFDEQLVAAVKTFQREQYLEPDGAVGAATRAALNISVEQRLEQIRANLDRARGLLHSLPDTMLLVDLAGYKITYFKAGEPIWRARVQVGMSYRTSPVFRSAVNIVTLNPTWTVPPTILRQDILPKLRQGDLAYLRDNNIRVLDGLGQELDPAQVDWHKPGNITLRQDAGPKAALGKAVIRFPNPHSVYLHDTPHQRLFEKSQRAFSSGCIRVERALELVQLLLADTPGWDAAALQKALAKGDTRNLRLAGSVPILLAYWTVDVLDEQKLVFKPDIYARDRALLAALDQPH